MKLNYFNFKQFGDHILLTNDFGRFCFVESGEFKSMLSHEIQKGSSLERKLLDSKMVYEGTNLGFSSAGKYELRDIKGHMGMATSLHIFVVTTACNMACIYCQANNGSEHSNLYMSKEIAEHAVDIALQSPNQTLTFEFQGGEPLLNFEVVKHIVEYTENNKGNKRIEYNIVTNLTLLDDAILDFLETYDVGISTSLDGPIDLHNRNRCFINGKGTFEAVSKAIERIKERGIHVGAIETTTRDSLSYPHEIVRTYADLGFDSLFLRPLTPLGRAAKCWKEIGYTPEQFISFYIRAVEELLRINQAGKYIREDHAAIFLRKIYGDSVNYMELRSPCGASIGQMAYYADGNIFTCDEGRMLYEMGNDSFRLGNVFDSRYCDLVSTGVCRTVCAASVLETIPTCCDCVYQPYCGTCPVVNYALYHDIMEKQPRGYRCKIYSGILDYLFLLIYGNDPSNVDVLKAWVN